MSKARAIASGIKLVPRDAALALGAGRVANHLLTVRVFSSEGTGVGETDWEKRWGLFAYNAAPYIRSLLAHGKIWGVTWGGSLIGSLRPWNLKALAQPGKKTT